MDAALPLLRELSGPHGIHASRSAVANYRAVFTRDAVMAGIAGLLERDAVVTAGLVRTLESLRALQGAEGQIASNYEHGDDGRVRVSFGTLVPRIDSTTWYLAGIAAAATAGAVDPAEYRESARAVVRLLDALEYNGGHLVYVPPGGDWADEYPYEGYVLYDQVLRAWALRSLGAAMGEAAWTAKAEHIGQAIADRYWPEPDRPHPIAAYSPTARFDMFDLAACSLLALSDVAAGARDRVLDHVERRYLDAGLLPPAFDPVIDETHALWPALRRYHLHGFRNRPHEYHNGGVWPIWIGWLALALGEAGRAAALERLREALRARLDLAPAFAFEEYLHGETGAPGGTTHMAYTATGLLLVRAAGSPAVARLLG